MFLWRKTESRPIRVPQFVNHCFVLRQHADGYWVRNALNKYHWFVRLQLAQVYLQSKFSTGCWKKLHSVCASAIGPLCATKTASSAFSSSCTRRTTSHQFIWQQHTCGAVGGSPMECGVGGQPQKTPHFHLQHRNPPTPERPSEEQPGSGLIASSPVSDVSAPACTNGVWPHWRPVSVAQKNKPSPMLSSNVQSIDLPPGLQSLTVLDDETIE